MTDAPGNTLSQGQIDKILDVLTDIMGGNFDRRLPVVDITRDVDAIHLAINLTAEELAHKTISKEYVESVLLSLADVLFVVDPSGTIRTTNDTACDLLGYRRNELLGHKLDLINSGDLVDLVSVMKRPEAPPVIRDIETVLKVRKGGDVPVVVNCSALRDEEGKPTALVLIARDIRRVKALIAKAEQAATSEAIIDGMPEAVMIAGFDGTLYRVNRAFEKRTGVKRSEAVGKNVVDLGIFDQTNLEKIQRDLIPKLVGKHSVDDFETFATRKDGTSYPISLSMSLIKDASDSSALIIVTKDISDRKKAEARIEHLNRVLRAIRNVNELIVKERDRRRLIDRVCKLLVETRGYTRAWIVLGSGAPVSFAQAGWGESFVQMAEFLRSGRRPPCERRAFPPSGVLAIRDPVTDCPGCPLSSCFSNKETMVVRFEHAGENFGLMAVGIPGDFIADDEERLLFLELAEDIAFALYNIGVEEERNNMLRQLKQANERYKTLFEEAAEGIALSDIDTQIITYANPALCHMLGYSLQELRTRHMPSIRPAMNHDSAKAEFEAQSQGLKTLLTNIECVRKDGGFMYVNINASKIAVDGKEYNLSFFTDVTQRKQAEDSIKHLNLVLRSIRNVNELIVKEKDSESLIDSACKLLVETGGYGTAWIVLTDGSQNAVRVTQAGWGERFERFAEWLKHGEVPPCGRKALSMPDVLVIEEPIHDCDDCPLAREYRSGSVMTARLEHDGKSYGAISVSVPKGESESNKDDLSLFAELASDIAFALYSIELEKARNRAEWEVKASEEKWRSLAVNMPSLVVHIDRHKRIQFINRKIFGFTPELTFGSNLFNWVPVGIATTVRENVDKVFRTAEATEFEMEAPPLTGARHWYNVRIGPIIKEGRVESILLIMADISDRKSIEEERHKQKILTERAAFEWQRTVDAIDSLVLLLNIDGSIIRKNKVATVLASEQGNVPYFTNVRELATNQPWKQIAELLPEVGQERTVRLIRVYDETSKKTWEVTAAFSAGQAGDDRIVVKASDVSKLVEIQESLRRSEVMSRMGVLLGEFAHEVRNPLFAVSATVDAMQERFGRREEFAQYLEVLRSESNRTKNLVDRLLEYGRPTRLSKEPESIDEVLVQAINACTYLAKKSNVALENRAKSGFRPILMDKERLVLALSNVLTNAIQFSAPGGRVTIEADEETSDGGMWIVCTVSDSGPGFDVSDTEAVFEPFFSKRRGGTGLGLALVRRVVEDHKGKVTVGNRPTGGGVATIKLRCVVTVARTNK